MIESNNLGLIIFSRMSSRRLPGKALMKINNRELLGRVIDRAKKLFDNERIVVATSNLQIDDEIAHYGLNQNIQIFRGSQDNVLKRAVMASRKFSFTDIVRICGDRPFISLNLIKKAINEHFKGHYDLTTTKNKFTNIPPGLTTEIIKVKALEKVLKKVQREKDKEHVTTYIYDNKIQFKIRELNIVNKKFNSEMRFVVDNKKDLINMEKLANLMDNLNEEVWDEEDWDEALISKWYEL